MPVHRLAVSCLGPAQLLERVPALLAHCRSLPASKVVVSLQPALRQQLTDDTVGAWARAVAALYSGAGPLDLTVAAGPATEGPGDHQLLALDSLPPSAPAPAAPLPTDRLYTQVVLGGTFDRLHAGHKVLLSGAALRCTSRLTVGVTGPGLLARKTLPELILPVAERIAGVETFLDSAHPGLARTVVQIDDPFGPAGTEPELECIVASAETERGCLAINQRRAEAGLAELAVHLVPIVGAEGRRNLAEEDKVSSSTGRQRLLGTRLRPALRAWDRQGPYIIGLTGGSCSGKSSVGRRLAVLGWGVVDCDGLGHQAYLPGAAAYTAIVAEWGGQVVAEDGTIDRRALGGIVFTDPAALARLNTIVWPEIARMAGERADRLWKEGSQVVVLDAAVLLEAGWEEQCHEVWVCVLPVEEAVARIVARDGRTAEEAGRRVASQMAGAERAGRAATLLCTAWDPEVTAGQVESAVTRLEAELGLS